MQVQMLISPSIPPSVLASSTSIPLSAAATATLPPSSAAAAAASLRALPGPLEIITSIYRQFGLRGFWLGHTGTLIRETGGSAAWFSTKEFVASLLIARSPPSLDSSVSRRRRDLKSWESAFSGACAGASYNLALFPADTVKSTMQTEAELRPGSQQGRSFWAVGKEMWAKQGLRGLYAGCGITIARSIPSSAIIFCIYDGLMTRFG